MKKVTFAENVKKHDGVYFHKNARVFYSIICGSTNQKFMKGKVRSVKTAKDVLLISNYDVDALKYSKERLEKFINDLTELDKKLKEPKEQLEEPKDQTVDEYWDNAVFLRNAKSRQSRNLSLVRRGCRDFSMTFSVDNKIFLTHVFNTIKKALEDAEAKKFLEEWEVIF